MFLYCCASVCFSILFNNLVDIRDILSTHQASQVILQLEAICQPLVLRVIIRQPQVLQSQVPGATLLHKVQFTHQVFGQEATNLPQELANTSLLLAPWPTHKDSPLVMLEHRWEALATKCNRIPQLPRLLQHRFVRVNGCTKAALLFTAISVCFYGCNC